MQAMVGTALSVTMVAAGTCAWGQAFPRDLIERQCEAEWPDSFTLQVNCVVKQETAFNALAQKRLVLEAAGLAALDTCETLHPTDFALQSICLDLTTTPPEDALRVDDDIPVPVMARIRGRCEAEWPVDYAAQAACIEERAADWRENLQSQPPAARIVPAQDEAAD